jgi:membrane protease YdiL (CAAX protease family)
LGLRRLGISWAQAGLSLPSKNLLVASALIGLSVIPLAGLIAVIIRIALGKSLENPQIPFLAPGGFSWSGLISMLFLGGIIAPFAEELFFRGVLFRWIRDRWGAWAGVLISGIIFGAAHGEVSVAVAASVLGFILAWIYDRSKSLWPSIIIHVVLNSINIAVLYAAIAYGVLLTNP